MIRKKSKKIKNIFCTFNCDEKLFEDICEYAYKLRRSRSYCIRSLIAKGLINETGK